MRNSIRHGGLTLLVTAALAGCVVEDRMIAQAADQEARRTSASTVKWKAQTDLDKVATYNVALNIAKRCASLKIDPQSALSIRPLLNRVGVFKGLQAGVDAGAKGAAAFEKKYGKPLAADVNHCAAGKTELRQQTAVAYLLTKA
jgi:hypothetical protein